MSEECDDDCYKLEVGDDINVALFFDTDVYAGVYTRNNIGETTQLYPADPDEKMGFVGGGEELRLPESDNVKFRATESGEDTIYIFASLEEPDESLYEEIDEFNEYSYSESRTISVVIGKQTQLRSKGIERAGKRDIKNFRSRLDRSENSSSGNVYRNDDIFKAPQGRELLIHSKSILVEE